MKYLFIILLSILAYLQFKLWLSPDGLREYFQIKHEIKVQQQENLALNTKNQGLQAEVNNLKTGHEAVEERARSELGMIKQNEKFYQIVHPSQTNNSK